MRRGILLASGLIAPALVSATEPPTVAKEMNVGAISASVGNEITSQYFFRGIVQEKGGLISQPFMGLSFLIFESSGPLRSVALDTGLWSSLHSDGTAGGSLSPSPWYEADFYAGLNVGLGKRWEVGAMYTAYTSPNGSFSTVGEISASLAYDDADHFRPIWSHLGGLQPSIGLAGEVSNTAFGDREGLYLEVAIEPTVGLLATRHLSLDVALPARVGLNLTDYYESDAGDDTYGYLDVGLGVTAGLAFIPQRLGSWDMNAGVHALKLGDNLTAANGNEALEIIANAGVSMTY